MQREGRRVYHAPRFARAHARPRPRDWNSGVLHSIGIPAAFASMKILVIVFLLAIVGSLASALFFLVHDQGKSKRTVNALAVRVGLSLFLFLMLMAGYYFGLIPGKLG